MFSVFFPLQDPEPRVSAGNLDDKAFREVGKRRSRVPGFASRSQSSGFPRMSPVFLLLPGIFSGRCRRFLLVLQGFSAGLFSSFCLKVLCCVQLPAPFGFREMVNWNSLHCGVAVIESCLHLFFGKGRMFTSGHKPKAICRSSEGSEAVGRESDAAS